MKRLLIVAVLVLGVASPASAADGVQYTGNSLLGACTSRHKPMAANFLFQGACLGYVQGIADAMGKSPLNGFRTCLPKGVSPGQLKDVVIRHLRSNPKDRHLKASSLVARAFQKAWPCK